MRRRKVLLGGMAGAVLSLAGKSAGVMANQPTPEEHKRRMIERRQRAIAEFPFERVETSGQSALATWEQLKSAGRGVPIVLGDDESLESVAEPFLYPSAGPIRTPAEILDAAGRLRHPQDLVGKRASDSAKALEHLKRMFDSRSDVPLPTINGRQVSRDEYLAGLSQDRSPEVGEWPATAPEIPELSVAFDVMTGNPQERVHIGLIPTDDWTAIPAYLRWGGWNECPESEYHVAALRSWRDRFGAELVGLSSDTINVRVRKRPTTRAEAMELAREQYGYCSDIVDQGVGTLSQLAAALTESEWWFFWWD